MGLGDTVKTLNLSDVAATEFTLFNKQTPGGNTPETVLLKDFISVSPKRISEAR